MRRRREDEDAVDPDLFKRLRLAPRDDLSTDAETPAGAESAQISHPHSQHVLPEVSGRQASTGVQRAAGVGVRRRRELDPLGDDADAQSSGLLKRLRLGGTDEPALPGQDAPVLEPFLLSTRGVPPLPNPFAQSQLVGEHVQPAAAHAIDYGEYKDITQLLKDLEAARRQRRERAAKSPEQGLSLALGEDNVNPANSSR
eukprot:tig00020610_g11980.t1